MLGLSISSSATHAQLLDDAHKQISLVDAVRCQQKSTQVAFRFVHIIHLRHLLEETEITGPRIPRMLMREQSSRSIKVLKAQHIGESINTTGSSSRTRCSTSSSCSSSLMFQPDAESTMRPRSKPMLTAAPPNLFLQNHSALYTSPVPHTVT